MAATTSRPRAATPNDLGRYFVERANAGDIDGLVACAVATGHWLWAVDHPSFLS